MHKKSASERNYSGVSFNFRDFQGQTKSRVFQGHPGFPGFAGPLALRNEINLCPKLLYFLQQFVTKIVRTYPSPAVTYCFEMTPYDKSKKTV